tara:strand:+ start:764 stop:883 length:120 start_codon:yes stop_codon:yes gene_type:complete
MKYEDLPEDVKADFPKMLEDISAGARTAQNVAQEILSRI